MSQQEHELPEMTHQAESTSLILHVHGGTSPAKTSGASSVRVDDGGRVVLLTGADDGNDSAYARFISPDDESSDSPPSTPKQLQHEFQFDSVHGAGDAWQRCWADSIGPQVATAVSERVLTGRTAALFAVGLNASRAGQSGGYPRQEWLVRAVLELTRGLQGQGESTSDQLQCAYALLGFNDQRCVNLLTDSPVTNVSRLQHGLAEGFFEPADCDFTALISKLKRGFSLPSYAVVIKVERVPQRLLASIDAAMDKHGDVYRGLMSSAEQAQCGYLYLFNLGTPRFDGGFMSQSLLEMESYLSNTGAGCATGARALPSLVSHLLGRRGKCIVAADLEMNDAPNSKREIARALRFCTSLRATAGRDPVNRVDDRALVLAVMEQQYRALRKQAREQSAQLSQFAEKLQQHLDIERQMKADARELKQQLSELTGQVSRLQADIQARDEKFDQMEIERSELIVENQKAVEKLMEEAKSLREQLTVAQQEQSETARANQQQLSEQVKRRDEEKKSLDSELKTVNKQLKKAEESRKLVDKELIAAHELIANLERQVGELQQQKAAIELQLNEAVEAAQKVQKANNKKAHAMSEIDADVPKSKSVKTHASVDEPKAKSKKNSMEAVSRKDASVKPKSKKASSAHDESNEDDELPAPQLKKKKTVAASKIEDSMEIESGEEEEQRPLVVKKKEPLKKKPSAEEKIAEEKVVRKRSQLKSKPVVDEVTSEEDELRPSESRKKEQPKKKQSVEVSQPPAVLKPHDSNKPAVKPAEMLNKPAAAKPGIINAHALQMIKANFTMPKLLKK